MLGVATRITGNIFEAPKQGSEMDCVRVARADMARSRQRVRTEAGTNIGINLGRGQTMRHGDVLQGDGLAGPIVVEQIPERVAMLRFAADDHSGSSDDGHDKTGSRLPILAGHIIGNRHRPISIREGGAMIVFPIQDDAELETFKKLLAAAGRIEISAGREVFVPDIGADVYGHQ